MKLHDPKLRPSGSVSASSSLLRPKAVPSTAQFSDVGFSYYESRSVLTAAFNVWPELESTKSRAEEEQGAPTLPIPKQPMIRCALAVQFALMQ